MISANIVKHSVKLRLLDKNEERMKSMWNNLYLVALSIVIVIWCFGSDQNVTTTDLAILLGAQIIFSQKKN